MFSKSLAMFLSLFLCITMFSLVVEATKAFSMNHFGSLIERNFIENSDRDANTLSEAEKEEEHPLLLTQLEVTLNECCVRQRKLLDIGFDVTGSSHYVDVGHCKHVCGNGFSSERAHGHRQASCPWRSVCEPTALRTEKYYLLHGIKDVEVIEDCECVPRPRGCTRLSRTVVLFPDTPHEREVDVGHCRGSCEQGVSCKALRNKTVSVDGPNGSFCVNVIEECSCEKNCYRAQYRDVFVDRIWNETLNETQQNMMELDIGVCVGHCADLETNSFQCVLWDSRDPLKCLMSLKKRKSECVPISFETHVVTKRDGTPKTILSVTECGCK